jgi:hypothetical protein
MGDYDRRREADAETDRNEGCSVMVRNIGRSIT